MLRFGKARASSQEASNHRSGCRLEQYMTAIYAAVAALILPVVYWARGRRYVLAALLVLAALYAAFVWLVTASMS